MSERLLDMLQYYGAARRDGGLIVASIWAAADRLGVRDLRHLLAGADRWGFSTTRRGSVQNVLFAINLIGVYRYLIRKKPVHEAATT